MSVRRPPASPQGDAAGTVFPVQHADRYFGPVGTIPHSGHVPLTLPVRS